MENFKEKGATYMVDDWTTVRKGKGLLAKNVNLSNKWVPTGNRFEPIGNLGQSLPRDAILVEEVDGASIAKHKNSMDHTIDRDLSNSSMNITDNNLLDSLVGEAHPKDNRILMQDDEGLGMKGDETLPLIVYEKNESHTIIRKTLMQKKWGRD